MIQKTITYRCRQHHCKDCGVYRVLEPKRRYDKEKKETILRAYQERTSMRGLERTFKVTRQTVARWIRERVQTLPDLKDTLEPVQPGDVLELDELWSFVLKKGRKRWLWTAMCRRTRQIVAFVIGDRNRMLFITWLSNGTLPSTTWPYHLQCNHYPARNSRAVGLGAPGAYSVGGLMKPSGRPDVLLSRCSNVTAWPDVESPSR